jgi:asparagine synthase (glutamine-hydrolysing)
MCGITGVYTYSPQAAGKLRLVGASAQQMLLRGPDTGGDFVDETVALGHRRLSIIDTSGGAAQPMSDHTGRYQIVFNGEIFNYRELAEQYLQPIWQEMGGPRTHSDTEVLLYLLIAYGPECLSRLSGFFALAFYDREERRLLLARDRYGKKPLLYYAEADYIAFASEMKALLAYDIPRALNYTALHQYLTLNYIPQPQSMLKGVAKLQPGHYMMIGPAGLEASKSWYRLSLQPERYGAHSYEAAQKRLVALTDNAVRDRMISDVPLGAFLSGGIDSSVVVALASRYTDRLHTFSVGYKDNPFFDETAYAQLVARKYNTQHTVFSLANEDFLEHVHGVLDYLDEPFADSSAIPVYILSKYTRQHVTVALSGDGGDEVFAGYNKHAAEWRVRQRSLVNNLVKAGRPVWQLLPRSRNNKITNTFRKLHRFATGAGMGTPERYWRWASFLEPAQVNALLSQVAAAGVDSRELLLQQERLLAALRRAPDDFNSVLLTDMNLVLLSDMLVKVDLMSMANSLEVRSPLLDHQVVDFAFGLPASYKIDGGMKKKILQDAFRSMLPPEIYNRPKHGFEIPLLGWFRKELWGMINDDLLQKDFVADQGIFNPHAIEALKKKLHSSNPEDSHATIWALIVFQYWWKKYFS